MTPVFKKNNTKRIGPHLPSEIRKQGTVDRRDKWFVLKTVGIAVLFGFFSGAVGGITINTRVGEDLLWGPNSKVHEYFSTSQAEHVALSRDTLTQKAAATTAGV